MPTGIGDELCWFCAQHDSSGVDLSGNSNNATIGSAVSTSAPPTDPNNTTDITWAAADGGGLTRAVNMSSAMAAVRTASLATGKYSISFWMLPSSTYNRRTFGTYQTNTRLRAGRASQGDIYAGLSTNGSSFYAVVVPSKSTTRIHHFVLTWDDNNEAKGYVDGVLVTTDSVSTYSAGNTGGAFNYPDSPYGGGYIDDVRAFDRILTQTEITHLATSRGIEGSPSSTGIRRINFSGGFQQLTGGFSG